MATATRRAAILLAPILACFHCSAPAYAQVTINDANGNPIFGRSIAVTGTISSAGTDGKTALLRGPFNVSISGPANATVVVERSFDQGATWAPRRIFVLVDPGGAIQSPGAGDIGYSSAGLSGVMSEPEAGVIFRVRVLSISSGSISYRLSQ